MSLSETATPSTDISEADERALLDSITRWIEKKVAPSAAALEQADEYPRDLVDDMKAMGLFGALIEPQWGGLGLSALIYS
ncbi:MAG: acyl-CoA dehydrogenase family protein, partial [Caulobacteraceae bacterium]